VAVYLGDAAELERTAQVFKGWLGDREAYAGFTYRELWWQCDPAQPVGINPKGCTRAGHSIDGAQPEEMRRGGPFQWPPVETGYAWEGLQGALVQAEILQRAGYPAWEWEDQALLRAVQFLYNIGWEAEGDDRWQMWLINYVYGTAFPTVTPVSAGKNMGWTDWTHSGYRQLSDTETITESFVVTSDDVTAMVTTALPTYFEPFGMVTIEPDFEVNGQGRNIDSIAFWEASDPFDTLMFITAKDNQQVEVWQYPFVNNELSPLRHASFGSGTRVNGVAVDQESNRLYVSVSEPASTVSVFSLPELEFMGEFVEGDVNLESEPNITLLKHTSGQTWAYVSADDIVYIHNAETGAQIGQFKPTKGLETLVADDFYQVIYIPDENDKTGIYAYFPHGTPYEGDGANNFGGGGIFRSDAEGIVLYTCPADGSRDDGSGLLIVAEQKSSETDFEFFDRQTWEHLGTVRLEGVSNTDGTANIQKSLPDYPWGIFGAINDDTSVVGVGWDKIFGTTDLSCGTQISR
jgi:hypothetical protein